MVLEDYKVEIPEQFKRQRINSLFESYDKQLREISQVFENIRICTSLDNAVGEQLDRAGDIVGLTRAEAGLLCGTDIYFDVIDDDRYRSYLKYKAYQNSNECTYYDLINALKMVWDVDEINYSEEPLYPATIVLTAPVLSPGGGEAHLGKIPSIRPAGVNVMYLYRVRYVIEVSESSVFHKSEYVKCGTELCGIYPRISTVGKATETNIEVEGVSDSFNTEYRLCGTYPDVATKGYIGSDVIQSEAVKSVVIQEHPLAGTRRCGIYF